VATRPFGVGIIGTGVISQTYLENLTSFPDVAVVAVGDLIPERARAKAEEFGIGAWGPRRTCSRTPMSTSS
jgi:predicted dehydrogenase